MNIQNVVAVTVTYNDYKYLKNALYALRRQTYPVQKIIVVDNNSLPENKILIKKEEYDNVEILWLPENCGGAGGFEAGMRYVHDKYSPDWYWLMDADAAPKLDCLEKLLIGENKTCGAGILSPLIYGIDLQEYQLYHHKKMSKLLYRDPPMFSSYDEIPREATNIDATAFVGPLISRQAVEMVGYVDGKLFIYGDDTEYTYRVSRKFDVLLIKDAIIEHRDQPVYGEQRPANWWKDYYAMRNWVLFVNKYKKNFIHGVLGLWMLRLRLLKQLIKIARSDGLPALKKIHHRFLLQGYNDGKKGIKGKSLDPVAARYEVEKWVGKNNV